MLKIKDIHFSVAEFKILKGVSFEISKGEAVGIIGNNGSGKTTLFNIISGFITQSSGEVFFKEKKITNLKAYKRARLGIGRVFQNFGIFSDMSVLENMITAIESSSKKNLNFILPWSRKHKANVKLAFEYLKEIGLESKAYDKANSLSGGQKRLLEIMRTIAFSTDLILLDEPTAGVSPKMKKDVIKIINKLIAMGKTVICIEHDISFIEKFCNRAVVLDSGKLILDDKISKVKQSPELTELYFGKS